MTSIYTLSKTWRYLMIIPAVILFILFWSLFIFGGGSLDMPLGAWTLLIVVTAISGGMIYGTITSKIVTSPHGIELISFGMQVMATWDNVEKIEFAPDGIVNLLFKEPVYTNGLASLFYDKTIQLSPYAGDLATSNLLKDLARHVPNSNIPEFAAQQKYSIKTFQEAGFIGLYYLGWFIVWFLFAIFFQKRTEEYFVTWGLRNTDPILTFVGLSLTMGLFFNAIVLISRYNAEIVKLNEMKISHKARTHYLSPFVTIMVSIFVGIIVQFFIPRQSGIEIPIIFLIGRVSLPISSGIEGFLFQDQ